MVTELRKKVKIVMDNHITRMVYWYQDKEKGMDEMKAADRIARKKAVNERLNIIREIDRIEETICDLCPVKKFNNNRYAHICAKSCDKGAYKDLEKLGAALESSSIVKRSQVETMTIIEDLVTGEVTSPEESNITRDFVICVTDYTNKDGYEYKIGETFKKISAFKNGKLKLSDIDGEESTISVNGFYANFEPVSPLAHGEEPEQYQDKLFESNRDFKTRDGIVFKSGDLYYKKKDSWKEGRFDLYYNDVEVSISKDTFYRNFDRAKEEENK